MLGLNLALSLWTSIKSWLPSAWFTNNEQGVWYDPSDFSTMYQDSAGTTPVTAVEQPVGLILDKSKGLVLGAELVANGDFSNGTTGWAALSLPGGTATLSVVGGALRIANDASGSNYGHATQSLSTVIGKTYTVNVSRNLTGTVPGAYHIGTSSGGAQIKNGATTASYIFVATTTITWLTLATNVPTANATADFDNISVRELPGNHATQATSTKRPVLSARVNLLTKTEDFGDAAWIPASVSVTPNAIAAPDGTVTADMLSVIAACAFRTIDITVLASSNYTFTFYAYRGTASELKYSVYNTSALADIVSATSFYSQTVAGAWSKVTLNFTTPVGCTSIRLFPIRDPGVIGTCYIWGASLVPADQASLGYQRVNTATDYDTVGFPHYLKFDGVDDALSTGSIDFTATDKMTVVAGVRKLSDAAFGMVFELSVNAVTNNGAFYIAAPLDATGKLRSLARGATGNPAVNTAAYLGATTKVLTVSQNLAALTALEADINRVNASLDNTLAVADAPGGGNYGAYPLYIGSRAGTSLPFNGHLYSLLIRGAQSTDAQIVAAETYVAGKTGVTL